MLERTIYDEMGDTTKVSVDSGSVFVEMRQSGFRDRGTSRMRWSTEQAREVRRALKAAIRELEGE